MIVLLIIDFFWFFIWEGCMVFVILRVYWFFLKEKLYFKDIKFKVDLIVYLNLFYVIIYD